MSRALGPLPVDSVRGFVMNRWIQLLRDKAGAATAEFALVAAIAGAAITFAAVALNDSITQSLDEPTECVSASVSPPPSC